MFFLCFFLFIFFYAVGISFDIKPSKICHLKKLTTKLKQKKKKNNSTMKLHTHAHYLSAVLSINIKIRMEKKAFFMLGIIIQCLVIFLTLSPEKLTLFYNIILSFFWLLVYCCCTMLHYLFIHIALYVSFEIIRD